LGLWTWPPAVFGFYHQIEIAMGTTLARLTTVFGDLYIQTPRLAASNAKGRAKQKN
jgi:hypothetical protein